MKVIGAMLLALVLLGGCGGTTGSVNDNPPSGSNADKSAAAKPKAKPTSKPGIDTPLKFGQAYTYKDGLSVKVGKPKPYRLSESGVAGGKGKNHLAIAITLVNKTGKPFDPNLVYSTLQSGNKEAAEDFDSDNGLNGPPSTKVLDGREVAWKVGYTVKDPNDLVLELSPDAGVEYANVLWQKK